jgi:DNA transformation protein
MTASDGFIEYLKDLLNGLGPVTVRRMFGGAGMFVDGVMFALILDDTLYFKADDSNRPDFEAEGLAPFSYSTKDGRNTIMSYWRCPDRLFDDPDEMAAWARKAFGAARRSAGATPARTTTSRRKARR